MITTNVDVEDGIVNGAIGELKYVEHNEDDPQQPVVKLWFKFESDSIGKTLRVKSRPAVFSKPGILQPDWTPISKRSANIKLSSAIHCKRIQFPVASASALTVHKSQGGTFSEIVYEYDKGQEQQLVYVGLSRVTALEGLYLTNSSGHYTFHHAKGTTSPRIRELRTELQRLSNHRLRTIGQEVVEIIESRSSACKLMSINVQSLRAHSTDISSDHVLTRVDLMALSETWLDDDASVDIAGFASIVHSKRAGVRAGGVAIYQRLESLTATAHTIEKVSEHCDVELKKADACGDICAVEITVNNTRGLLFCVYISPGK